MSPATLPTLLLLIGAVLQLAFGRFLPKIAKGWMAFLLGLASFIAALVMVPAVARRDGHRVGLVHVGRWDTDGLSHRRPCNAFHADGNGHRNRDSPVQHRLHGTRIGRHHAFLHSHARFHRRSGEPGVLRQPAHGIPVVGGHRIVFLLPCRVLVSAAGGGRRGAQSPHHDAPRGIWPACRNCPSLRARRYFYLV